MVTAVNPSPHFIFHRNEMKVNLHYGQGYITHLYSAHICELTYLSFALGDKAKQGRLVGYEK